LSILIATKAHPEYHNQSHSNKHWLVQLSNSAFPYLEISFLDTSHTTVTIFSVAKLSSTFNANFGISKSTFIALAAFSLSFRFNHHLSPPLLLQFLDSTNDLDW
jgi:hypothetical protein